jgi:triphosphatase
MTPGALHRAFCIVGRDVAAPGYRSQPTASPIGVMNQWRSGLMPLQGSPQYLAHLFRLQAAMHMVSDDLAGIGIRHNIGLTVIAEGVQTAEELATLPELGFDGATGPAVPRGLRMATEIELKLQLSPKTAKALPGHRLLTKITPTKQQLLNTYFDTPALDLHARRVAMRFRKKGWEWLLTVKSAEPASGGLAVRNEWETAATPGVFDFSHVDNEEFRSFLENVTPDLEPIFTTDFRRQIWHVPFGESLIEMALDRGCIKSRGKSMPICEIELELISGRIADIFALTRQLQEDLELHPAIASKAERGYNLFKRQAQQPFRSKPSPLSVALTPVAAFRSIALSCLEHFQRNESGLRESNDPEYVHQARVALRRLRSAIKLFTPVLPQDFVAAYGETWRTLASALGDARNWDVFLEETLPPIRTAFPKDRNITRLHREGLRRARRARKAVTTLITLPEYPKLVTEFTAAVFALNDVLPIGLKEFAQTQLSSNAKQARKLAGRHPELQPDERHKMRIRFKRLRYTLEFFAPLLANKRLPPYLSALNQLQDELGLINDHVTAETLINEALTKHPKGPVHGWVHGRHALLISELPEALEIWLEQRAPWR